MDLTRGEGLIECTNGFSAWINRQNTGLENETSDLPFRRSIQVAETTERGDHACIALMNMHNCHRGKFNNPGIGLWLGILLAWTSSLALLAQTVSVVTVNADKALVINGRTVFPIGFSPGPPNNGTTPDGKDALQELRDAGGLLFRMAQTTDWNSTVISNQQVALNWAAQHGMYVWLNLRELSKFSASDTNTPANLRNIVNTFKNHPGLGLWKNFDEAWWAGVSVADLQRGYDVIKQEDTNHPVVQTHAPRGTVADLQPYNVAADILALDIYPVTASGSASNPPITNTQVSQVGDWTKALSQVANGEKEYWLIEQIAFSGTTPPAKALVFPTFTQSRYMAYQAIVNGARGLLFYGGNIAATLNAQDAPYGWNWTFWTNVLKAVVEELGDHSLLADALVAPESTLPVTFSGTTAPDLEFCVREVPPYIYILACKRETTTVNVTFSGLPASVSTGDLLYESPRTVTVQSGQFTDSFAPLDVHVYRFLDTNQGPTIISHPQSRTNNAGTTADLSVSVTGGGPLAYRWRKNGLNLSEGGTVSGATSATLTLANVLKADAGSYSVVVTNLFSNVTSSLAVLEVIDPAITNQPPSRMVPAGGTAAFTVGAAGTPSLSYRWKKGGVDLSNGGNVSGATSSTLTLSNVQNGDVGNYSVAVTNTVGFALSAAAALALGEPPLITEQPISRTNVAGSTATFSVGAQGNSLSYQWLRAGTSLSDGANISGSASATLTLASVFTADAANYSVIVSNAAGSITSAPAALTVLFPMPYCEPFNYPVGSKLGGQTSPGFLTWDDVGTSTAGPYVTTVAGNLNVAGLSAATGNSIWFGGLGKSARFSFAPSSVVTSGLLYYSFVLRILDTNGLRSSGMFIAGFNNTMGTQTAQPTVIGTRLYIRSTESGFNLGLAKNSSIPADWVWDSRLFTTNQLIFVVGGYTFNPESTTNDVSSLWIDPSASDFGSGSPPAASLTTASGNDISSGRIASFVFFQRDAAQPAAMLADELRIGPTWASVTPPPSATLSTLTGLMNLGNGVFQFAYTNSSGQPCSVYASTNLVVWTAIGAATQVSPGQFQFIDTSAANHPRRFYQLRSP